MIQKQAMKDIARFRHFFRLYKDAIYFMYGDFDKEDPKEGLAEQFPDLFGDKSPEKELDAIMERGYLSPGLYVNLMFMLYDKFDIIVQVWRDSEPETLPEKPSEDLIKGEWEL